MYHSGDVQFYNAYDFLIRLFWSVWARGGFVAIRDGDLIDLNRSCKFSTLMQF